MKAEKGFTRIFYWKPGNITGVVEKMNIKRGEITTTYRLDKKLYFKRLRSRSKQQIPTSSDQNLPTLFQ